MISVIISAQLTNDVRLMSVRLMSLFNTLLILILHAGGVGWIAHSQDLGWQDLGSAVWIMRS